MTPRPLIYTPSGNAGEYANKGYAANPFANCDGGCKYCFVPAVLHKSREQFASGVTPVADVLERLEYDLTKRKGIPHPLPEPLFLSFTTDPFPNEELVADVIISAIHIIHDSGNRVRTLTKRPSQAPLTRYIKGDEFGVSLTLSHYRDAHIDWEPNTDTPGQRITRLSHAHDLGIITWASFEPTIVPWQTLVMIERAAPYLTYCKIGKFNHSSRTAWPSPEWKARVEAIDWRDFTNKAARLCDKLGLPRYIKQDLRPYLEPGINPDTLGSLDK